MGLDNGIEVKNLKKEDIPSWMIKYVSFYNGNAEIAYWRKCWGVRRDILDILCNPMVENEYEFKIDREDIPAILRKLKKYFDKEYYDEYNDSIWEYEETFDVMIQRYINISWLYDYWESHPELEVIFYDSY